MDNLHKICQLIVSQEMLDALSDPLAIRCFSRIKVSPIDLYRGNTISNVSGRA